MKYVLTAPYIWRGSRLKPGKVLDDALYPITTMLADGAQIILQTDVTGTALSVALTRAAAGQSPDFESGVPVADTVTSASGAIPAANSVNNSKVAPGANIDPAKLAPGTNTYIMWVTGGVAAWGAPATVIPAPTFSQVQTALAAASSSVTFNAKELTGVADPTAAQSAATKAYVDALIQGLNIKPAALSASATNLALSGLQVVDGQTGIDGTRTFLFGQTDAKENGPWLQHVGGWTRPLDFAVGASAKGSFIFVEEGPSYGSNGYVCTSDPGSDVIGTNNLTWSQFSGAGQIIAGNGITKSGNTLSANVYQVSDVTLKPGGTAIPGQVVTSWSAAKVLVAALIAAGAYVRLYLDGTANGNAVALDETGVLDGKNRLELIALDYVNGADYTACTVTTIAGVQIKGVRKLVGEGWLVNTSTGACFLASDAVLECDMVDVFIDTTSASNAAFAVTASELMIIRGNDLYAGTSTRPIFNISSTSSLFYLNDSSALGTATCIIGTGVAAIFCDASSYAVPQTSLTGAGGTQRNTFTTGLWSASTTYQIDATVYYSGLWYVAIAAGLNKNPSTQTSFWQRITPLVNEITFKPGGVAIPGSVYTTDASMRAAVAIILAAGENATVFLDGSANSNTVTFTVAAAMPTLGRVHFVCVEYQSGSYSRLDVTTAVGVQFTGGVWISGGAWMCTTSAVSTFIAGGVEPYYFTLDKGGIIDSSSSSHAAISLAGISSMIMNLNEGILGALASNPVLDVVASASALIFVSEQSALYNNNAIEGNSGATVYFVALDTSVNISPQTTFTGAGGNTIFTWPTSNWISIWEYPAGAYVNYLGGTYRSIADNTGKTPDKQPSFWTPISTSRYYQAGNDLWYKFNETSSTYANAGTAGTEALTASAGVIQTSPGLLGNTALIPSGDRIKSADTTKNPSTTAATIIVWFKPAIVNAAANVMGKFVTLTDVNASIALGFTAAGLPVASIRRNGQVTDDTATASSAFTLGAGQNYCLAATYDGSNLKLYVNGTLAATTPAVGVLANTAASCWCFGALPTGGGSPFAGQLIDATMDNTVFAAATLQAIAKASLAYLP